MKLSWLKIKLYLAMTCIGLMAFLVGVPIVPKEKVARIIQASNQNEITETIQAGDEQR